MPLSMVFVGFSGSLGFVTTSANFEHSTAELAAAQCRCTVLLGIQLHRVPCDEVRIFPHKFVCLSRVIQLECLS